MQSVIEQMELKDKEDEVLYTSMYVRRQVIAHFLGSYARFKGRVKDFVSNELIPKKDLLA